MSSSDLFPFQSLIAGGSFSLALSLMVVTNVVALFTVPPMLVWLTDLTSRVNVSRFGILILMFFLISFLPTIVSSIYIVGILTGQFLTPYPTLHRPAAFSGLVYVVRVCSRTGLLYLGYGSLTLYSMYYLFQLFRTLIIRRFTFSPSRRHSNESRFFSSNFR